MEINEVIGGFEYYTSAVEVDSATESQAPGWSPTSVTIPYTTIVLEC